MPTDEPRITTWRGVYGERYGRILCRDSARHPAKASLALLRRIVQHGLREGYWSELQTILDPFLGVGTTALVCGYNGLCFFGCDIEPDYVELAENNLRLHTAKMRVAHPQGREDIRHGDAREIHAMLLQPAHGAILSPPYADCLGHSRGKREHTEFGGPRNVYGTATAGNIGRDKGSLYWKSMGDVYSALRKALLPNSVAAIILKDHVAHRQRVRLCDQTCDLLTELGYRVFERTKCMLANFHPSLLDAELDAKASAKGFFRRLAEKRHCPPIDEEEVIWTRTPLSP